MSADEKDPAWEDMGYGALPDHLKDSREDWQKLGYSSAKERETERWGDHGGEKPIVSVNPPARLSESRPDRTWRMPSKVVAQAKCAAHRHECPNLVDVTESGMDSLESFSGLLAERNEPPLELNACFLCDECYAKRGHVQAQKSAERRGKVTEAVRYLKAIGSRVLDEAADLAKAGRTPDRAGPDLVAAVEKLGFLGRVMGPGYVSDLVIAIREGGKSPGKAKPKAGDL